LRSACSAARATFETISLSVHIQKSPIYTQKSPTYTQKSPTHTQHSKEPYTHSTQPYTHSKEPYIHSKEPYTHSKEPYVHSKEPYTHTTEPYTHSKEPYIYSMRLSAKNKTLWHVPHLRLFSKKKNEMGVGVCRVHDMHRFALLAVASPLVKWKLYVGCVVCVCA